MFPFVGRTWTEPEKEGKEALPSERDTGTTTPRTSSYAVPSPSPVAESGHVGEPPTSSPLQVPAAASCVYCAIKNLFANYQFGNCEVLPAAAVRTSLATCWASTRFKPGDMEDADETLEGVLDALHAWHQGLSAPPPSAYFRHAHASPEAGAAASERDDLSNPLKFLAFYRDIPCNPPCLAHRLFSLHLLFLPRCTACGATGEPLVQQLYVHRAYTAELLPLLASKPGIHSSSAGSGNVSSSLRVSTPVPRSGSPQRPSPFSDASALFLRTPESAVQSARQATLDAQQDHRKATAPDVPYSSACTDCGETPFRTSSGRSSFGVCLRYLFLWDWTFASRESLCIPRLRTEAKNAKTSPSDSTSLSSENEAIGEDGAAVAPRLWRPEKDAEGAGKGLRGSDAFGGKREESKASLPPLPAARTFRPSLVSENGGDSHCCESAFADSDSLEDELKRLQQFFQHANIVRLSPQGKAKKKEAAARGGDVGRPVRQPRGQMQRGEGKDGNALTSRAETEDAKDQQRGDCDLTWLPDLAQLGPSSPGLGSSSSSEASFEPSESGNQNGVSPMQAESDEVRQSIFLLLQSLEPVLDVREIFSSNSQDTQVSSFGGHRSQAESRDQAEGSARDSQGSKPPAGVVAPSPFSHRGRARREAASRAAVRQEVEAFTADMDGKHVFRGMVCFYGQHYVCFFHHWASAKWVLFDDSRVKRGLTWKGVVSMCVAGKLLPCLLFFERISLRPANRRIKLSPPSAFPSSSSFGETPTHPGNSMRRADVQRSEGQDMCCRVMSEDSAEESPSFARRHGQRTGNGELWREGQRDEYGKEDLQLFCAEMLSCQHLLLEEFSTNEAKKTAVALAFTNVPSAAGDSASSAAPCRIS
ncbi:hypothetical protein NCLIV_064850 [Neospora caninum Liverpool]|uniref:Peptidase C19 ubiquitin carboxyl-terminal hydrolase domain-containing protein n=1 Tax=Neospora caninum (strain Liverpool) TaxID=572307 RepID=F0VQR2_NEOCL|nr:hypothetical protein NCLIV_064850 [Neospora caninum Liverpool]CBZ56059.1 hypothetical protein NCLIV_064850 [Neospora caninum Liverpool]|eukprot:XP_003886085.1 hypothetical protein NCLIV_064850 [Neospora caninum Liverpool]